MLKEGVSPDAYTFPTLLKSCASLGFLQYGLTIHQHILVNGYASDVYVATSLVHFYAKCGLPRQAHHVFDKMPERNVVPWTAMIGCYSQMGDVDTAFCMYNQMRHQGVTPNSVTVLSLLSGVSQSMHLQCIHACTILSGLECAITVTNSLLNVYAKCGRVEVARKLFEEMHYRDIVSWNSLVSGYAHSGYVRESMELLMRMRSRETKPDQQTFATIILAIAEKGSIELGKMVHAQIVTSGLELDMHIETTLISMYLKCGDVDQAFRLLDQITDKDIILWTTMISGLVQNNRADLALHEFQKMLRSRVKPSTATIASVLAACAQLGSLCQGTSLHCYVIRQKIQLDVAAKNSLLSMYAKCGHLKQCQALFDRMHNRDLVSWNAVVAGYAQNGHLNKAFLFFSKMRIEGQNPDSITVVSLLQACASLGALHQGKWVHNFIIRNELRSSISVDTALVDMYSKCGNLVSAHTCFDQMPERDLVSWSTIIAGYGSHGKGETAMKMYSDFLQTGIKPNHVIFLSALTACSHAGLVSEGLEVYQSMTEFFRIEPKLEHHACVVDLLSRAGRLQEAHQFIVSKLEEPTPDVLGILLDACRVQRNVELGEVLARQILRLEPDNAGNYVQLAHSYASRSRWDGVEDAWTRMRSLGLKKAPGWSLIELHGNMTLFFVDHTSHPQIEEITSILKILDINVRDINPISIPATITPTRINHGPSMAAAELCSNWRSG